MSNLGNLTAKIMADGEAKSRAIIEDANREAQAIVNKASEEASAESQKRVTAAQAEAQKLKNLTLSAKRTEIRDRLLAAKQKTIAEVLARAKARLMEMSREDYEAFLWQYLKDINISQGETLVVPERYMNIDMNALNAKLASAGKPPLTLHNAAQGGIAGGFKLTRDDVENDNTLDALIEYHHGTLEQLVVEQLFGKA